MPKQQVPIQNSLRIIVFQKKFDNLKKREMWAQSPTVTMSYNFSRFSLDEYRLPILLFAVDSFLHSASFSNIHDLSQSSKETEALRKLLEKELLNLEEFWLQKNRPLETL